MQQAGQSTLCTLRPPCGSTPRQGSSALSSFGRLPAASMDRPPSRASQDSFASANRSPGSGYARPPSAARAGTASLRAPSTATRNIKPGTGVQSWAAASPFVPQVADRPVTQQGLAGVKTAGGASRQMTDKTFCLTQLRQQRSELIEVNSQLQVLHLRLFPPACLY